MQSFRLKLGMPTVGWLPVEIEISDLRLAFEASDLGLNVIDQLVVMVRQLEEGIASSCYFYLEPRAYIVTVKPFSHLGLMVIEFVEDLNHQDISTSIVEYQGEINIDEFRMVLENALRSFVKLEYGTEDWPIADNSQYLNQLLNS